MTQQTHRARTAYRRVQTDTAGPEETVVLVFDGMLRLLYQARTAMSERDLEGQGEAIVGIQRILSVLADALDDTADPDLAAALRATYTRMINQLMEANIRDDLGLLDGVIARTQQLAQAWRLAWENLTAAGGPARLSAPTGLSAGVSAACAV